LESSFNPEASEVIKNIDQVRETFLDQVNIALFGSASVLQLEPVIIDQA